MVFCLHFEIVIIQSWQVAPQDNKVNICSLNLQKNDFMGKYGLNFLQINHNQLLVQKKRSRLYSDFLVN